MNYDFSGESEQKEFVSGPVPAGSMVIVRMFVLEAAEDMRANDDPHIRVTRNGLRQLYAGFEVTEGSYAGVKWKQSITLAAGMQNSYLSDGQRKAATIGGATLKAILQSARRSLAVTNLLAFDGLTFPVKVKINDFQRTSQNGNPYWVNEIAQVITPDKKEYALVQQKREIINENGAVTGKDKGGTGSENASYGSENYSPTVDDVPF